MSRRSDDRFLVLHGLRLKGFGEPPAIGAAVGLSEATVSSTLPGLRDEGFVLRRDGRLAGWALTKEGRVEQQRLAAEELAATGTTDVVRHGYERFLALNASMLGVCTDWQVRGPSSGDPVPNDHDDPAYDGAVLDRLRALDAGVEPILTDLAAALARYGGYRPRFANALAQLDAGALEWFTKPIIDSYHTIWFELHEDLLSSLGIERSQEGT
jgi:hypothetical protein